MTRTSRSRRSAHTSSGMKSTSFNETSAEPPSMKKKLIWELDPTNNVLYSLSPGVHKYLYSKYAVGFFSCMVSMTIFIYNLSYFGYMDGTYSFVGSSIVLWMYPIPWMLSAILSVNNQMLRKILVNPDTYIISGTGMTTMGYSVAYMIMSGMINGIALWASILFIGSLTFFVFLSCVFVCSIDGVHGWNQWSKIGLFGFLVVFGAYMFFYCGYIVEPMNIAVPALGEYGHISVAGSTSSSCFVLCTFVGKLAWNAWRKGSNRCIGQTYVPYIEWKEIEEKEIETGGKDIVTPKAKATTKRNDEHVIVEIVCHTEDHQESPKTRKVQPVQVQSWEE